MPDTLIYGTPEAQRFLDSLPDSVRASFYKSIEASAEASSHDGFTPVLLGLLLVGIALILVVKSQGILSFLLNKRPVPDNFEGTPETKDFYFYQGTQLGLIPGETEAILQRFFPYYNNLQQSLQPLFTQRLKQFMHTKVFVLPADELYKAVPVLFSATATQLTFGLENFTLPWYKYVCVHSTEYLLTDKEELHILAGHVEKNIITIAWNKFMHGIAHETDGANVGLHELAHALYFQEVVASKGKEKIFIDELSAVMQEGEEVYEQKSTGKALYTDYAYKNMQEFWAESIEIFFERPCELQKDHPDFYNTLKELLNQDPQNKSNPLIAS